MSPEDEAQLARALAAHRLLLPKTARGGRVGGVPGARAGGSMELHDFREYEPGDDMRQLDWNAAARTDRLMVRVRREEVAPRLEIVVDTSRSMALTQDKEARTKLVALLFHGLARRSGLDAAVVLAGDRPLRMREAPEDHLRRQAFESTTPLFDSVVRAPVLRPCGIRVVVSDLLIEAPMQTAMARLARDASALVVVQPFDTQDCEPDVVGLAGLIDSETGERLDREVDALALEAFRTRFEAHQSAIDAALRRVHGQRFVTITREPLDPLVRAMTGLVLEVA